MTGTLTFNLEPLGPFKYQSNPYILSMTPIKIPEVERKLIAMWKFDKSKGSTVADSSGNANDGILKGNPIWQPSVGKFKGALLFDGDGDYVQIGNESSFDITNQITVSAWVNISSVPVDWAAIVTKGDTAWRLSTDAGDRRFHFAITESIWLNGQRVVTANEWHHIAGIYDGRQMRTYIDGEMDVSRLCQGNIGSNDYPVYIGENAQETGRYWNGLIDDVRIYSYALSEAELAAIYAGKELGKGGNWPLVLVIAVIAAAAAGCAIYKIKAAV
jgi:hypothetical protein